MRETATFVGGPLDGQTISRPGNRWALYRGDGGKPISADTGNAEWVRRRNRGLGEARRYYIRQDRNGAVTYVHASAWSQNAVYRP